MERRNRHKWVKDLKVAVINRDIDKLSEIVQDTLPKFDNLEDLKEAKNLVDSAMVIFEEEQAKISKFLTDYQKMKKYNYSSSNNYMSEWVG